MGDGGGVEEGDDAARKLEAAEQLEDGGVEATFPA